MNQKIEGFYLCCKHAGLTGRQGVMIPHANIKDLMLRDEVIEAVANGTFHIWAVRTIDEGIEILTGVKAGARGKNGAYPKGTINRLADERLRTPGRYSGRLRQEGRKRRQWAIGGGRAARNVLPKKRRVKANRNDYLYLTISMQCPRVAVSNRNPFNWHTERTP